MENDDENEGMSWMGPGEWGEGEEAGEEALAPAPEVTVVVGTASTVAACVDAGAVTDAGYGGIETAAVTAAVAAEGVAGLE